MPAAVITTCPPTFTPPITVPARYNTSTVKPASPDSLGSRMRLPPVAVPVSLHTEPLIAPGRASGVGSLLPPVSPGAPGLVPLGLVPLSERSVAIGVPAGVPPGVAAGAG